MNDLAVLFRTTGNTLAALALEHVVETMRPLPIENLAGTPRFVLGAAVVRGEVAPVLNVGELLVTDQEALAPRRWIALRIDGRVVVLAVADVVGVRAIPRTIANAAPPLLGSAARGAVGTLSLLDGELLVVLETAMLVTKDVWAALDQAELSDVRGGD